MPSTVTVTGVVGPAQAVTAAAFSNVTFFSIDTEKELLHFVSDGRKVEIEIAAVTTITLTVSGNAYALTLS